MKGLVLRYARHFFAVLVLLALVTVTWAQVLPNRHNKRAKPPQFPESLRDTFFDDATTQLVGPRPAYGTTLDPKSGSAPITAKDDEPSSNGFRWSRLVRAETLEDEIKALQIQLRESMGSASKFKSGGYKESRRQFSELAALLGIIAEFDENVRWRDQAAGMREKASRAARQCKVGNDASFHAASKTKDDLEQLVLGGNIATPAANKSDKWPEIVDRAPLMRRFELAQQQHIGPALASSKEFGKRADQLAHEAELLAAFADVIQREGFEFADDETYLDHARKMRNQAKRLFEAAKTKDYPRARAAAGEIDKACSACHEGYRD